MNRFLTFGTAALLVLTACGGSEAGQETQEQQPPAQTAGGGTADEPGTAAASELTRPEWYQIDETAETVTLDITAGATSAANYWNFNGFHAGSGEIVVPAGYTVTINFDNADPNLPHSIGVDSRTSGFPANFSDSTPVFEGAISSNPTSMTDATMPGQSETITFTASEAGEYSLVCYIPGHASVGMYVAFTVSAEGSAGVRE